MDVQVNWLAVILAAASSMVIGSIWYARPVFGTYWGKMAKIDEKKMKTDAPMAMASAVVMSLLTAFVLAYVSYLAHQFYNNSFMLDAVTTAFWLWLGFSLTSLVTTGMFEQRRKKLILLNITNQLVTYLSMGLIIGALGI